MNTKPLGELVTTLKGKKPKDLYDEPAPHRVPYIDISAVEKGTRRQFAARSDSKVVPAGSLVMVWDGARSGWVGFTKFEGALGSTLAALESPLEKPFLAAFLRANFHEINSNPRGTGIPHVNPDLLKSLDVPILDADEQLAMARLTESVAAKAQSSHAHLASAARGVERFRDAVRLAACSGRLTADWRSVNPESSSVLDELVSAHLVPAKLRRGVDPMAPPAQIEGLEPPKGWAYFTVAQLLAAGALADVKDGNHGANHPKVDEFTAEGLPFITANTVQDDGIAYDAAPRVSGHVLQRLRVGFSEPDDVVLTHKGTVGRVAVATRPAVLTPQTTYYRCAQSVLNPGYFAVFLRSLYFYEQLSGVMSQTTRDFVPISEQYKLTVLIPPYAEQVEIDRRVDSLLSIAVRLDRRIDSAARRVELSSRSVLAKAFRGELTANGRGRDHE